MRFVLDTNVLVSAIICDGNPRKLLMMGTDRAHDIIVSQEILQELRDVLSRPKFQMTENEIEQVINNLTKSSEMITVESNFKVVEEDPDDNNIINTAYDSNAKYIVSGDKHLLKLKKFKDIKIISVREMLNVE